MITNEQLKDEFINAVREAFGHTGEFGQDELDNWVADWWLDKLSQAIQESVDGVKKLCNDEVDYAVKQLKITSPEDTEMIEYLIGKRNAFNDVLYLLHSHSKDEK